MDKLQQLKLDELRAYEKNLLGKDDVFDTNSRTAVNLCKVQKEISDRYFPHLHYLDHFKQQHASGQIKSYLEIGVFEGDSIRLTGSDCISVGVDPDFKVRRPVGNNVRLYKLTSDDFFKNYSENYSNYFDMIFVDGLHEASQSLRDVCNAFEVLKLGGEIFVHDVLPISPSVATSEQQTLFWTGDVWQAASAICERTTNYKWEIIPAAPSGLLRIYDVVEGFSPDLDYLRTRLEQARKTPYEDTYHLQKMLKNS